MPRIEILLPVLMLCLAMAGTCLAESKILYGLGVRYGTNEGADKKTDLQRYDVYGTFNLPWSWQLGSHLDLDTRLMASAGMLDGEGDAGFIGTAAPGLCFTDRNNRFSLEFSAGVAIIPDYRLGDEDFGGPIQFIIDAGLGVRLYRRLGLGYRFQHFSDASLWGSENRGVDMHLFELGYRFSHF